MTKKKTALIGSLLFLLALLIFGRSFRSDPDRLWRETIREVNLQDLGPTIVRLDEILAHHPDHSKALLERAKYSGSKSESLVFLQRVRQGPPEIIAEARLLAGNILLEQKRCQAAITAFEEAVRVKPAFDDARHRLLTLNALLRKPAGVRAQLQQIRRTRLLTLSEMDLWITADERLTPFPEAVEYLEAFLLADQNDADSLRALCVYLAEESQQDVAFNQMNVGLARIPGDSKLTAIYGHFLLRSGDINAATRVLGSLVPSADSSIEEWHALGQLAYALRDFERARVASEFLALSTPFERSRTYLHFQVLNALGEVEQASRWKRRSEILNDLHAEVEKVGITIARRIHDPEPVVRVASLLLELDRPVEAAEWIQMAVSLSGEMSTNGRTESLSKLSERCTRQSASYQEPRLIAPVSEWNSFEHLNASSVTTTPLNESGSQNTGILLTNRAAEMGLDYQYENGHTGRKYLIEAMGGGVSTVDLDLDGWPDLYCPQGGTLGEGPRLPAMSDQIFRNLTGNEFRNVTEASRIQELGYSQGAAVGDINGDGFPDIVVANFGRNTLFLNCGDGTFEDATVGSGLEATSSMSASVGLADLDGDGHLDVYVANYVDGLKVCRDDDQQIATCNPASHQAAPDEVYTNLGDGRFRDISSAIRGNESSGRGLGVIIARFDTDLRPDIFVSNDMTPNFLFINRTEAQNLRFEEMGFQMGVAVNSTGQAQAGMGIACADLDHDLRPDLYVTNFHQEANSLFLQRDPGLFQDMTASAGLREPTLPFLGFGTQAVDLDLDGWMELFVTNGHIDDQRKKGADWQMTSQLFRTVDGLQWNDISSQVGPFMQQKAIGRGVSVLDANRDGQQDLAIAYQDRPLTLLINETSTTNNSVVLCLIGVSCSRNATNAVVYWEMSGQRLMTELRGGDGYYCSNERRLTLGLGASELADLIEIHWPDGKVEQFRDVIGNKSYLIRQGMPLVEDTP